MSDHDLHLDCPHAERCPGCPWHQRPRSEHATLKHARVRSAVQRYPELASVPIEATVEIDPTQSYRTRAKLRIGPRGEVGLFARGTFEVIDIPRCKVLAPSVKAAVEAIRALLGEGSPNPCLRPALSPDTRGALVAVDVREVASDRAIVTLVLDQHAEIDDSELSSAAAILGELCPEASTIAINRVAPRSPQVLGPQTRVLAGGQERDRLAPSSPFTYAAPGSFVQAHRGVASAMHDAIAAAIPPRARVIELYAGSGALALRLASSGAQVIAVESFQPAIERLTRAAREQRIASIEARAEDATSALASLSPGGADVLIVDPPRRGLPAALRIDASRLGARQMIYVSCDPDTLARDLAHLARLGLGARTIVPHDMMPWTDHVEAVAFLAPSPLPPPHILHEDEALIAIDKAPHEPTTPHPEHPISALDRVRGLAPEAVPVHRLDAGTSGVCLFARSADQVTDLAAALARGRKSYLAMVRGITHRKGIIRRELREDGTTRSATTRYARRKVSGGHSLLRATPAEGRTHQIRRHFAAIGHPILGDERYGHTPSNRHMWERAALDRTFLHCERIEIDHRGTALVLQAPLPPDLALVLDRLEAGPIEP